VNPTHKPRAPRRQRKQLTEAEVLEYRRQVARETLAWLSEWLWKKGRKR
jgi:hypothetical protein